MRPGKVDLQFIVRALCGREVIFTIHYQKNHFFQRKLSKGIQKFMRVRKSVKNWSKIASHNEIRGGSVWSDAGGDDKLQINFAWPKYFTQNHCK